MSEGMKNRNPIQQFEVTFPKYKDANGKSLYGLEGEGVIDQKSFATLVLPPFVYQCCCQEDHKDDTKHLHCGVKLLKPLSKKKLLDFIKARLPEDYKRIHVSAIQSWDRWRDYCKKEDPNFYEEGTLEKKKKEWWRTANGRWLLDTYDDEQVRELWAIYNRWGDERAVRLAVRIVEGTVDERESEDRRARDMAYMDELENIL